MPFLHYFYPENDGALAADNPGYTGSRAAIALRKSGQTLALWTGAPGDRFISDGVSDLWLQTVRDLFGREVDVYGGSADGLIPRPWGWSQPVRRAFLDLGFPKEDLPSDAVLDRMRMLSHRRSAAPLAAMLRDRFGRTFLPPGIEARDTDSVMNAVAGFGRAMVKQPWSGSGRGVMDTGITSAGEVLRRAAGTIRKQGSVMVEPYLAGATDIGLLFESHGEGERPEFVGLSLFTHDSHYTYTGSIVGDESVLRRHLAGRGINVSDEIITAVADGLGAIVGDVYRGPLGVDMLFTQEGKGAVAEINLRDTMGHVARRLAANILTPGLEGLFTITLGREDSCAPPVSRAEALEYVRRGCSISDGRLTGGSVDLSAPDAAITFRLSVKE